MMPSALELFDMILRPHVDSDNYLLDLCVSWGTRPGTRLDNEYLLCPFVPDGKEPELSSYGKLCVFMLTMSEDHPAYDFVDTLSLNLYPGSIESFAWIKESFDNCQENHSECNNLLKENQRNFSMPKRLLDVGQFDETMIQLVETGDSTLETYAIASYAWGSGSQAVAIEEAKTTTKNIELRMISGMELASLPRTIQDLVEVTRRIGHRYVWLDAFCIIQDDLIEKPHQLNLIVEFYKRADVLISAASASNCDEGFLQPRSVDQCYGTIFDLPYRWKLPSHEIRGSLFFSEKVLNCATDKDPVDMRIWTFQEHLVSSRVISFGSRQIKWKCQKNGYAIDGGEYSRSYGDLEHQLEVAFCSSQHPSENDEEKNWRVQAWMTIVEQYSLREYSHPEDRVPAFYESISRLAPLLGWSTTECVDGIWKPDASRQLLWKKEKPLTAQETEEFQSSGPSWSWATLPGGVIYDTGAWLRKLGDSLQTIYFQEDPGTPRCLVVKGYTQEASGVDQHFLDLMSHTNEDILLVEVDWDIEMAPQRVLLLDLSPNFRPRMDIGLVLVQVGEFTSHFKRCGRFRVIEGGLTARHEYPIDLQDILYSVQQSELHTVSII
jgi:hypothetical protein